MPRYGLLIDYEFCTGCHTCEIACKQEHGFPVGKWGIKLAECGPLRLSPDKWAFDYIPVPNELCDLCSARVRKGEQPVCVKHCQAGVMKFGTVEELAGFMALKPKTVLFAPR